MAAGACPSPASPTRTVATLSVATCRVRVGLHHPSPVGQWLPGPRGCRAAVTCRDPSHAVQPPKAVPAELAGRRAGSRGSVQLLKPPSSFPDRQGALEHGSGRLRGSSSHQHPTARLAFRGGSEEERCWFVPFASAPALWPLCSALRCAHPRLPPAATVTAGVPAAPPASPGARYKAPATEHLPGAPSRRGARLRETSRTWGEDVLFGYPDGAE